FWDAAGGTLLATATGPEFSVNAIIPSDAAEGTHYLVAYGYNSEDESQVEGKAEAVVTVAAPSEEKVDKPVKPGGGSNSSGGPSGGSGNATSSAHRSSSGGTDGTSVSTSSDREENDSVALSSFSDVGKGTKARRGASAPGSHPAVARGHAGPGGSPASGASLDGPGFGVAPSLNAAPESSWSIVGLGMAVLGIGLLVTFGGVLVFSVLGRRRAEAEAGDERA
ncbi:MAG TPA: hypothetical protein VM784_07375, partial [Actinomycetota bacterium]|nr:hypothetical protein [Actinomycetota bacterium]